MANEIKNWSFKKIEMFAQCPFQVKLKYIERMPEPPEDPKKDKSRLRGIEYHDALERFIRDGDPLPAIMSDFAEIATDMRDAGVQAEAAWYFDDRWQPMEPVPGRDRPPGYWLEVKLDLSKFDAATVKAPATLYLGDWKTGKKYGNEIKHLKQMQLYGAAGYARFPEIERADVELLYLDQNTTWDITFSSSVLARLRAEWDEKAAKLFEEKLWRPRPSVHNCRYCPYSPSGTGACPVGVTR